MKNFNKRWFAIEEQNSKFRYVLLAPNNKQQYMGYSDWVDSEQFCVETLFCFIEAIRNQTYTIEIQSDESIPQKYHCVFLNNKGERLLIARGYPSYKQAQEREKRICCAVEKSFK